MTVPVSNLEDGGRASRPCAGNVLRTSGTGTDTDSGRGGDFKFALVEDHSVASWLHGWRGEVTRGGIGVHPVLSSAVVPVHNGLETGGDSAGFAVYVTTTRGGDIAGDTETAPEGGVETRGWGS